MQECIIQKKLVKNEWDKQKDEQSRVDYKEAHRRAKKKVAKAKEKAYKELYEKLNSKEGEKDLYWLAKQRGKISKDVQQVRLIKGNDGNVLTSEDDVLCRWKEYFDQLMNEENERETRLENTEPVNKEVKQITKEEVRRALKRMKVGKAVGPDIIPIEAWIGLGEIAVDFLTTVFNKILESEKMPDEWKNSVLVPIFKNKGDVQNCSNYRGIKY